MTIQRAIATLVCGLALFGTIQNASAQDKPVKIGILEDMSGPLADLTGPGNVYAARLAIEDFGGSVLGKPIELISADHLNKPDVASAIARRWFDVEGVTAMIGLGNSAAALAARAVSTDKQIDIVVSGGSSDLTGKACSQTGFHWVYDTYALAKSTGSAAVKAGNDTWFFLTADYAFGHALERDTAQFVKDSGGKVLGAVRTPFGTQDYASFLLQAQASKAKIIGLANAGGDTVNSIKQAGEFGIVKGGQKLAGLLVFITDVNAIGLNLAQGLLLTEAFYWDLDDDTRKWSERFFRERKAMPNMLHAGTYSAVLHYLKAVKAAGTTEPKAVAAKIREIPVNDFFTKNAMVREDGRLVRDMYLFQVKAPSESKKPWDYYTLLAKVPGKDAFRPLQDGGCPYIKK
jgi:branched-chain amino acid transport system substrate-binding protein